MPIRQQAITWTNVDQDTWCHMASIGHELMWFQNLLRFGPHTNHFKTASFDQILRFQFLTYSMKFHSERFLVISPLYHDLRHQVASQGHRELIHWLHNGTAKILQMPLKISFLFEIQILNYLQFLYINCMITPLAIRDMVRAFIFQLITFSMAIYQKG